MTDKEQNFWTELRFSISRTEIFDAYCDWIEPKSYSLNSPTFAIQGKVGFLTPELKVYKFQLTIPYQINDLTEMEWMKLALFELDLDNLKLTGDTLEIKLLKQK